MTRPDAITVADVVQALGPDARVVLGLSAPSLTTRAIGPAYTCVCAPGDNLAIHAALSQAPPGAVIVADAGRRPDGGYFGELMATDAMNRKLAGAVILGAIRDLRQIDALGFPVFFEALCPISTVKKHIGSVGEPLNISGTMIATGDTVLVDSDGLVVVDRASWPSVLQRAIEVMDAEARIEDELHRGEPLADVLALML